MQGFQQSLWNMLCKTCWIRTSSSCSFAPVSLCWRSFEKRFRFTRHHSSGTDVNFKGNHKSFWVHCFSFLVMLLFSSLSPLKADYFKWELQVFEEGPGTTMKTIPVLDQEILFKWSQGGTCRVIKAWTKIEPELTIEGKTLSCKKDNKIKTLSIICRDNRNGRRYNRWKEIYPEPLTSNLILEESLAHESAYLRFRCYF